MIGKRRVLPQLASVVLVALVGVPRRGLADEPLEVCTAVPEETSALAAPGQASPAAEGQPGVPAIVGKALWDEVKRYASDSAALVTNPLHWDQSDIREFGLFAFTLGGLFLADQNVYAAFQNWRSDFTNRVSDDTTKFGAQWAWAIAGGLLAGGLIANDSNVRDTGREAIEAALFAGLITNILKPIFARERPYQSDGQTIFHGFSTQYSSFPSGHATLAWAVASVVAMRTDGWIVPTVAYGLATVVAMDRVNDQAHFASDVFTGAAIGLTTGRFIVNRHRRQSAAEEHKADYEIVPIRDGLALHVTF